MPSRLLPLALIVAAYVAVFALRATGRLGPARGRRRAAGPALYGGTLLYLAGALWPAGGAGDLAALLLQSAGALLVVAGLLLSVQAR